MMLVFDHSRHKVTQAHLTSKEVDGFWWNSCRRWLEHIQLEALTPICRYPRWHKAVPHCLRQRSNPMNGWQLRCGYVGDDDGCCTCQLLLMMLMTKTMALADDYHLVVGREELCGGSAFSSEDHRHGRPPLTPEAPSQNSISFEFKKWPSTKL